MPDDVQHDGLATVRALREMGATSVELDGARLRVTFGPAEIAAAPPRGVPVARAVDDAPSEGGPLDEDGELRMLLLSTEEGTG